MAPPQIRSQLGLHFPMAFDRPVGQVTFESLDHSFDVLLMQPAYNQFDCTKASMLSELCGAFDLWQTGLRLEALG